MTTTVHSVGEAGKLARERRKALGYTQADVANLCGTGTRFISDFENGKATIEFGKAITMLEALGLDLCVHTRGESQ